MSGDIQRKIIRGELIGVDAEVIDALNKANIGISGKITDETKNMLKIGDKMIVKKNITLKIKGIEIKGSELLGRAYDRIKVK